ncbi:MAG TPA: TlpA disulfide reductase family protein [Holophagaceae bacterium]|nr:TlpA disulfide reductase family protein [Holophagaceae bacterium]
MKPALALLFLPAALLAQDRYLVTSPGQPSCPRINEDDALIRPGGSRSGSSNPSGLGAPKGGLDTAPSSGAARTTEGMAGAGSGFQVLEVGKPHIFPMGQRPSVAAFGFTDKAGTSRTVADLKGKVVVIGFWTTSCDASCRELMEMADLQPKGEKFGFQMVPVNFDPERWAKVMPFIQKNAQFFKNTQIYLPGIGAQGPSVLAKVIPALPAVFIADRDGNLAYAGTGYEPNALAAALSRVLKEAKPAAQ